MSNTIKKDDPRLTAFVLGELSPTEAEEIRSAISGSAELAAAVEEIRVAVELLGSAYQTEAPMTLHDQQKSELTRIVLQESGDGLVNGGPAVVSGSAKSDKLVAAESDGAVVPRRSRRWLPIALAASLIGLLVGGALYFDGAGNAPGVASRMEQAQQLSKPALEDIKAKADENVKDKYAYQSEEESQLPTTAVGDVAGDDAEVDLMKQELPARERMAEFLAGGEISRGGAQEGAGQEGAGQEGGRQEGTSDVPVIDSKMPLETTLAPPLPKLMERVGGGDGENKPMFDDFDPQLRGKLNSGSQSTGQSGEQMFGGRRITGMWSKDEEEAMSQADPMASDTKDSGRNGRRGEAPAEPAPSSTSNSAGASPGFLDGNAEAEDAIQYEPAPAVMLPKPEAQMGVPGNQRQANRMGAAGARPATEAPADQNIELRNIELRISEQKIELNSLQSRLGPGHRDVEKLKSTIEAWERFQDSQPDQTGELTPSFARPGMAVVGSAAKNSELAQKENMRSAAAGRVASGAPVVGGAIASAYGNQPESATSGNAPQQIKDLGLDFVTKTRSETKTRAVPTTRMRTETKTLQVPVTRTRMEDRTRMVNGKEETYQLEVTYTEMVTQNYTVQVPTTEQVTQNYTVQVPYTVLSLDQTKADQLITELASGLDPKGKTEFKLEELIRQSATTWDDDLEEATPSENATGKPADPDAQARRLAVVLSNELSGKSAGQDESRKKPGFDVSDVLKTLDKSLAKRNAEVRRTRTWKRVKAVPNTTRLMVGDKDELDLTGMQVNVQVDGFRARVLIDCFYYNDRSEQLEGNFKLRLPDDASLYYFAFGESAYDLQPKGELAASEFLDDGTQFVSLGAPEIREARKDVWENVKEARMVPREKAAHAYRETVRRKIDPALVEWSGAGVFNARVFPLAPKKLHRIVIGYDVNLTQTDGGWTYQLDLPEEPGQCQVDLNIQPVAGVEYNVTPDSEPSENVIKGKSHQLHRFLGKQANGIKVAATASQILLHSSDEDEGEFWGIQIKPDLPVEEVKGSPVGIFMVDTSLSSNPDKFNVWLEMLRSTLTNNRDSMKHFNVLFFNVDSHFWKDGYVANTPENVEALMATCDTLALEGATDLYGAISQITNADWAFQSPQSSESQRPDLFLLSDGAATWGETNLRLIGRQLADDNLGSLFAYQTGLTGTSIASLRFLAGESGGAVFSVATEDEIKTASTAHRKRPWKLNSVTAAGATDTMTAGRVQWVYPGQSLTIVGRGELEGPIELDLDQGSDTKTISIALNAVEQVESELASRLYGQVAVGQLESLGAKVFDVAASYARHFRVTGDTCSLLMLETEADYQRFNIRPEEDLFVIKSRVAKDLIADTMKKSADTLADPKAQTLAWLKRLETMPGMSFKMPTALKLAMDDIEIVAISKPLECSLTEKKEFSETYLSALKSERLDYEKIAAEASRRAGSSVDEAIKVYSSLVERNPGDIVIARDVAFTAMELERPAQAFHLLKRVARARPFQGSIYPALGQCLTQLGQSDMAIVYYEVALGGTFERQGNEFKQIVSTQYMHLLRKIKSGKLESSVPEFAAARLETLKKDMKFSSADVVITMMWNTDQTDVDLHVVEPSGEECSYENKKTRSGGGITSDITTGFGPEMYLNTVAPKGKYEIKVKYFGNGQNRTELRNKVHLMIYRDYGRDSERVDRRTIQLKTVGEKESVATIGVE